MLGLKSWRCRPLAAAVAATALLATASVSGTASADQVDDVLGAAGQLEISTDSANPVEIEPGMWSDVLAPAPSSAHEFVYHRSVNASAVHVSVLGIVGVGDGVEISTSAGRVEDCGSASFERTGYAGWEQVPVGTRVRVEETDRSSECMLKTVPLRIRVQRKSSSTVKEDLPIRIKVVEEAPLGNPNDATNGQLPEAASTNETFDAPEAGSSRDVQPATGFDDAEELSSGTVTATIHPGEAHFYRAQLGWGQTLAARAEVEPLPLPTGDQTPVNGPDLALVVADPLRNTIDPNLAEIDERVTTLFEQPDELVEPVVATTGFGPVTWLDRYSNRTAYLPGDHWVVVTVQDDGEEDPDLPITYELTMEVQGEEQPAPGYSEGTAGFLTSPDSWSDFASGHRTAAGDDGSWLSAKRTIGLGLVLGGVVCLGLGGWRVRRTRS